MMLSNKISSVINILAVIIVLNGCSKSEPSSVQKDSFIKNFGGAYEDEAVDLIKDNSNYYILGNILDEENSTKIYLAKTDEFGNRLWDVDKTFSQDDMQTKAGQIIKLQHQPGFAIIGSIENEIAIDSIYFQTYIIIIDENGEIIAENIISNPGYNDYGKCIGELDNGDFTIATLSVNQNSSASYIDIITATSSGEFLQKSSPIDESEPFQICRKYSNDGFYISAYNTVSEYPFIILIDADGTSSGSQKFGTIDGQIKSIAQDNSGNTFICGKMNEGKNGGTDGFIAQLVNIEESINYVWLEEFGNSKDDEFEHLALTINNEIIVTGIYENINLATDDIWVVKATSIGYLLSELFIGGDSDEKGVRILESEENKIVIEGTTEYDNNTMVTIFKTELK